MRSLYLLIAVFTNYNFVFMLVRDRTLGNVVNQVMPIPIAGAEKYMNMAGVVKIGKIYYQKEIYIMKKTVPNPNILLICSL